ncbi:hypothetical protein EVC45_23125, partial [Paraburkholderia sp. UYCP14C]|uniref:hypothetical protein n=1 Tax=Paraburkholderia sp. UYCP14C TaxID=2511130 RepID=UPI00101F648C
MNVTRLIKRVDGAFSRSNTQRHISAAIAIERSHSEGPQMSAVQIQTHRELIDCRKKGHGMPGELFGR